MELTEAEWKLLHEQHVKDVLREQEEYQKFLISGPPSGVTMGVMRSRVAADFDSFVKLRKHKEEERRKAEEGISCERCGARHFTVHPLGYGIRVRCVACKHEDDFTY